MFTRLAESALVKFSLAQSRRIAPGPRQAFTHCNDNLSGVRRPAAAGRRRSPPPVLACHWFDRNGRLECRWQVETSKDAPIADVDERVAKATKARPVPTPEQIDSVLERSPTATVIERRNRAIVAFTWLTGVRDGALVTLKVRHVDLAKQLVDQDPREVKTKNSKQLRTTFFGVGGSAHSPEKRRRFGDGSQIPARRALDTPPPARSYRTAVPDFAATRADVGTAMIAHGAEHTWL